MDAGMEREAMKEALRRPFHARELEWRVAREVRGGRSVHILCYLTARAVMDRLDEVFGVDGWSHRLRPLAPGADGYPRGMIGSLKTVWPDGRVTTHEDVCESSDIEPLKGAASGSLKRAAVHLGIGRYLYSLGDTFVDLHDKKPSAGAHWHRCKSDGKTRYWEPPILPPGFLPAEGFDDVPLSYGAQEPEPEAPTMLDTLSVSAAHEIEHWFRENGYTLKTKEGRKKVESRLQACFGVYSFEALKEKPVAALDAGFAKLREESE